MHHRPFFDLGSLMAPRTSDLARHLFDHELDVRTLASILQDRDVFEAHQGPDDFTRLDQDEGASCF